MIYKLPSRSQRKYRGKYPFRIHSLGFGGHCHFELNNGTRLVCNYSDVLDISRKKSFLGADIDDVIGYNVLGFVKPMEMKDYAAIVLIQRIRWTLMGLRGGTLDQFGK